MSKADALKPAEINRVLKTCLLMKDSEAKRCALVLSHAAMRVTEIALIEVKNILHPCGQIKEEMHLPSKICKNLKPRTIWLTNPKARVIIQEWINYRLKRRWGIAINGTQYQGLNPDTRFIFNNRGRAYSIQPQPRRLKTGVTKIYQACDALEAMIRDVYRKCGLHTASSHSGRKSLVTNAVINGTPLDRLARILGHASPATTIEYVVIDENRMKEMCGRDWI